METTSLRTFDKDDLLMIKLFKKTKFISEEELDNIIEQNSGKQLFYALLDSKILTEEQISKILRLRSFAVLCPHCEVLNLVEDEKKHAFCSECHQFLKPKPETKKYSASSHSVRDSYGKYKIVEEIGVGGSGIVFKSIHQDLERVSALKILKTDVMDEVILKRFKREAQAIASLNHPYIVTVYDIGEEYGLHYIAMEFIDGKTLSHFIRKGKLSLEDKIKIVIKIAKGLEHAHKNEIIHRDIKPDNIMITKQGVIKITDFGLARGASSDNRITKTNVIMGTPVYMSPEQIVSQKEVSYHTDIYSLGVVLYEFISKKVPFEDPYAISLLQKIVQETPLPPNAHDETIPEMLNEICMKAMEKDLKNRYPTMADFRKDLEDFLQSGKPKKEIEFLGLKEPSVEVKKPLLETVDQSVSEEALKKGKQTDAIPPKVVKLEKIKSKAEENFEDKKKEPASAKIVTPTQKTHEEKITILPKKIKTLEDTGVDDKAPAEENFTESPKRPVNDRPSITELYSQEPASFNIVDIFLWGAFLIGIIYIVYRLISR